MTTQGLDRETERYLSEILEQEKITTDELIKSLIRDRWLSLQSQSASVSLSESTPEPTSSSFPKPLTQKQAIAAFMRRKRLQS